ncbi:hypothetical protein D3C83_62920 [compost metagenome]
MASTANASAERMRIWAPRGTSETSYRIAPRRARMMGTPGTVSACTFAGPAKSPAANARAIALR